MLAEVGMSRRRSGPGWLERWSGAITTWTGSATAFGVASGIVIAWAISGPMFHYSDTWQLAINTGTTIVTFLMVFLIQRTQNKDSLAIQLKLNELVAAVEGASNRLIDVEDFSEEELHVLHKYYSRLAAMAKKEEKVGTSHSVEEAEIRHARKSTRREDKD
jgi:low affinity Fe/Cu permease